MNKKDLIKEALEDLGGEAIIPADKPQKEKKEKVYYTASEREIPDLVDIVVDRNGDLKWLLDNGSLADERQINGRLYKAPPRDRISGELFLPDYENVMAHAQNHSKTVETGETGEKVNCRECPLLFQDLLEYHKSVSQLPDDLYYLLLVAWDFHTYCLERAEYSPIIYFYSTAERGKSRTIKGMTYVAYRGIRKGDIKDAQLLRDCTHIRASITFDMTDFWNKVKASGSEDVVLNRYERGVTVTRINNSGEGAFQDTEFYDIFGPTVLATNEIIGDIADSRALMVPMRRSTKDFENDVTQLIGLPLKERLVAFKLVHRRDEWAKPRRLVKGRLGDITKPLYQVILNTAPQHKDSFKDLVHLIERTKLVEKASSVMGEIVGHIAQCESWIESGILPNQVIVARFNKERDDREKWGAKRVSNNIASLGFIKAKTMNNSAGFLWDAELVDKLVQEYDLGEIKFTFSPVSPESPDFTQDPFPNLDGDGKGEN